MTTIDGALSQARRLYLHALSGGEVKPGDLSRLISAMERAQSEMQGAVTTQYKGVKG